MLELDACCGYKHMWKDKDISNIIFIDVKREVKPTIIADAKHLPFRDKIFNKIYCDPPHMIRNDKEFCKVGKIHYDYFEKYGNWKNRQEWIIFIAKTNIEFKRVLKDNGILWYKIIDGKDSRIIKLGDLNYMDNFKIINKSIMNPEHIMPWRKNITYEVILKIKEN